MVQIPEKSPIWGEKPVVDTPTKTPGVSQDEYQASMSGAAVTVGPTCRPSTTHSDPNTSLQSPGTSIERLPESSETALNRVGSNVVARLVVVAVVPVVDVVVANARESSVGSSSVSKNLTPATASNATPINPAITATAPAAEKPRSLCVITSRS